MKNPAEEIVTAWLQECQGYFTMNNIKVPKAKGGMGAEIDILGMNKKKKIWVEVSVSTYPRCNFHKKERFTSTVNVYLRDFKRTDKLKKVSEYFKGSYEMWLVYGELTLSKEEKNKFPAEMLRHNVLYVFKVKWINLIW